jgi:hypothetical protein
VLAGNSPTLLRSRRTHTKEDAAAIAERVLLIRLPPEAGHYLQSLGPERLERWISQDLFARHVMWLYENHDVPVFGRFGPVPQENSDESRRAATLLRFSGSTGRLLEFIYRALVVSPSPDAACVLRDQLLRPRIVVDPDQVTSVWQMVMGNERLPHDLADALDAASHCKGETLNVKVVDGIEQSTPHRSVFIVDDATFSEWMRMQRKDKDQFEAQSTAMLTKARQRVYVEAPETFTTSALPTKAPPPPPTKARVDLPPPVTPSPANNVLAKWLPLARTAHGVQHA